MPDAPSATPTPPAGREPCTPEALWDALLALCRASEVEIPTATGLFFRATADGDCILVTRATRYYFKVALSKPRRVTRAHFVALHPHYLACSAGHPGARSCAAQASRNTSYVFALYDLALEGFPDGCAPA